MQENQQLLKKLFKRLDPTVSRADTDVQGEVQVSLKYDLNNSRLLVNVIKCRELGLNSISGKTAQPFVAVSILDFKIILSPSIMRAYACAKDQPRLPSGLLNVFRLSWNRLSLLVNMAQLLI